MSAARALALEETPRRLFPRHPINVPLDLIVLRSGVPENLPGRCTDISEAGVGAVVAGEMAAGQQVAVELRLPNVGVPVRARARVRYQSRLHCGLEFVGLSVEQREMIRYWVYRADAGAVEVKEEERTEVPEKSSGTEANLTAANLVVAEATGVPRRRVRVGRRGLYVLLACVIALGALGWWQWQRSWSELETHAQAAGPGARRYGETQVSFDTMQNRIVTKVEPVYPEAALAAGTEGLVVLDAVIAADGSVGRLRTVSGPSGLVQSATVAVQGWKFEPYLYDGKPVAVETSIAVEFRLK
jgi:TonB family protein